MGWAEDFGREILKILGKKSGKSGGKFGPCVLEAELVFFFFKGSATWARKSDGSGMRVSRIDKLVVG